MVNVITKEKSGSTFDMQVGEVFVLEFDETPTTGYRWHMDVESGISVISSDLVPYPNAATGGGGLRRFVLKLESPGKFQVQAKLWREWIGEGSVIDRFNIAIQAT